MFWVILIIVVIGVIALCKFLDRDEKKAQESAEALEEERAQRLARELWPDSEKFKAVMEWVRIRITVAVDRASKNKISLNSKSYIRFNVYGSGICDADAWGKNYNEKVEIGKLDYKEKGYDEIAKEMLLSFKVAIYNAVKNEYGDKYTVTFENDAIFVDITDEHPKLK